MLIGACRLDLHLPGQHSLKEKRQVLGSVLARIRQRFDVAAGEVDAHDLWQSASVGIVCVSTSPQHANEILSRVVDYVQRSHPDAEITGYEIEILHAL